MTEILRAPFSDILTISKHLECFDGFPYIEALGDSEKKQSPNMSNSRSCFVKPIKLINRL